MKIRVLILMVLFCFQLNGQSVVDVIYLTSYDRAYFETNFSAPARSGVDLYRMLYTTTNIQGQPDTVSGLLCMPQLEGFSLSLTSYSHGTAASRYEVPGYLSFEHQIPALYSCMGTVTFAPDYLGLGYDDAIHPYVHADSEAWVNYDMYEATLEYMAQQDLVHNDQLFITGYSQGGHAAMAFHRMMETEKNITVTGALPMSGPYSLSTAMADLLTSDEPYFFISYIAATAVSFHEVYGNIFPNDDIYQFFKEPYADAIASFVENKGDLFELNEELIALLIQNEGAPIPQSVYLPEVLEGIQNDINHPVNVALRDNDVYEWAPEAFTRLIYCRADDQVTFTNSIIAQDTMQALGAFDVLALDIATNQDHGGCVSPAITIMLFYLLNTVDLETVTSVIEENNQKLLVYPNPAQDNITIDKLSTDQSHQIHLINMQGQMVMQTESMNQSEVNLALENLQNGVYILMVKSPKSGFVNTQKISLMR